MDLDFTRKCFDSLCSEVADLRIELCDVIINNDVKLKLVADKLENLERGMKDIQIQMNCSKTGAMIWKIEQVSELLTLALEDKEVCICSDFLYTGIYGYKLQFRLYPNGMGAGQDTHFSLYVFLHKTEHDFLLPWPFKQKVKVKVLDFNESTSKRNHHIVTIGPERSSSSFVRPVHEHNPGWGFPTFLSHEDFQSYSFLRENCLFLKIMVEPYDVMDVNKLSYD